MKQEHMKRYLKFENYFSLFSCYPTSQGISNSQTEVKQGDSIIELYISTPVHALKRHADDHFIPQLSV